MTGLYLFALLVSISGLLFIDYRLRLAFFLHFKRTLKIMLIAEILFIVWDISGIVGRIFFIGQTKFLLGLRIGQFPLEELFFLILLNYSSLLIYLVLKRRSIAS